MPLNDYDSLFETAGKQYNVDPQLIKAVAYNESRGDPDVIAGRIVSSTGAQGLMQFMPATAKGFGIDPLDPKQAIPAAAKYLSEGLDKYGSVDGALKYYAGGPNEKIWGVKTNGYPNLVADAYGKVSKPVGTAAPAQDTSSDDAFSAAFGSSSAKPAPDAANDAFSTAFAAPQPGKSAPAPQAPAPQDRGDVRAPGLTGMALDAMRGKLAGNPLAQAAGSVASAGRNLLGDIGAAGRRNFNQLAGDFTTPLDPTPLKIGNEVLPPTPPLFDRAIKVAGDAANYVASPLEGAGAYFLGRPLAAATDNRLTKEQVGQDVSLVGQVAAGHVLPSAPARLAQEADAAPAAGNRLLAARTDPWTGAVPGGDVVSGRAPNALVPVGGQSVPAMADVSGIPEKLPPKPLLPIITRAGAGRQADRILAHFAADGPTDINTSELVPGSSPTLAQATGNPGIASLEKTFKAVNPNPFVERAAANGDARSQALLGTMGTQADIDAAVAAREAQTSSLRDAAFAPENIKPADAQPIIDKINEILASPAGKRDAVQSSLKNILSKIQTVDPQTGAVALETDPQQLYGVRKAIGDALSPLAAGTAADGRQAARELQEVQGTLDRAIESGAPGFGKYIDAYSAASRPIDGMGYLQGLNLTDANGHVTLAKVDNAIKAIAKQQKAGGAKAVKSITDEQFNILKSIRDDLRREGNSNLGKPAGSDTFQNLANNSALSMLSGPRAAQAGLVLSGALPHIGIPLAIGRYGLNRLGTRAEQMVQQELQNRLLNPPKASGRP